MNHHRKSILFLPFLQLPSGHHQVADSIVDGILQIVPDVHCEKTDILSYSYGKIESLVSSIYLKWIFAFPNSYNWIYQQSVYKDTEPAKRYPIYEWLFVPFIRRLIKDKQPDLIICTHALPSYMLNYLKENRELNTPVINVYTDYFVHNFWGVQHIDYHFVPSTQMKKTLLLKGIDKEKIFITGIPIHQKIKKQREANAIIEPSAKSILITGGSLGVGAMEDLINSIGSMNEMTFYVLCGKNERLLDKLQKLKKPNVIPLPYIDCKDKMNKLYDDIDAVVTKPGGVTISESLFKRKPIFVYHALPGQEEINLQQLKKLGLIFHLNKQDDERSLDVQLYSILKDSNKLMKYQDNLASYHENIITEEPPKIIKDILQAHI